MTTPSISLVPYTTFGVHVQCKEMRTIDRLEDLEMLRQAGVFQADHLVLGGGSNLLFTKDYSGTVLLVRLMGKTLNWINETEALVHVAAGENWHQLVLWTLEHGLGGLENLSLIPGNAGTAPVQNIGAYGVEIKDVLESVEAFDKGTGERRTYTKAECQFGYRESIFKGALAGQVIITGLTLRLSTQSTLHTQYGAIAQELEGIDQPTCRDVSQAVIRIRQSKLPDPAVLGNAGSFFKNPVVPVGQAQAILERFPQAPTFPAPGGTKLAAGWLIEQAGWKGFRRGDAGVHSKQALVLVNYGQATGTEVWQLACDIMDDVEQKFGIRLQPEVNVL
jgi:UDP-N-acetylmuramate dehydrogenase